MDIEHDDRLECWNPAEQAPIDPPRPPRREEPLEETVGETDEQHCDRHQTGLCVEAQADGVPCPDPSCRCEKCGRAQGARATAVGRLTG